LHDKDVRDKMGRFCR